MKPEARVVELHEDPLLLQNYSRRRQACCLPQSFYWSSEQFHRFFSSFSGSLFIASDDFEPQGVLAFTSLPEAVEIQYLEILPPRQGQGLARQLMEAFLGRIQDQEVWLEVHQANRRAQIFYERHLFRPVGLRPRYYSDGGAALLMTRQPGRSRGLEDAGIARHFSPLGRLVRAG